MIETNDRRVARSPSPRARRAFLVAFPTPAILPVTTGVIGRTTLEEAKVFDPTVSRKHLHVTLDGNLPKVAQEPGGGRNGVWVEGFKLDEDEKVTLHDGAVVRLSETILVYREAYSGPEGPAKPIGSLQAPFTLHDLRERLDALGSAGGTPRLLIEGQTGTGKEALAHAVHEALERTGKLEGFNAAAVPAELCDSILFGVVKGAHSGAHQNEEGLFYRNRDGTVFLDELGDLPLGLQAKLLRFLDSGEIQRVGGTSVRADVAVVAATNVGIKAKVNKGLFRRDLAARFDNQLRLPPLADRIEDIPSIVLEMSKARGQELVVEPLEGTAETSGRSKGAALSRVEAEAMEMLMLRIFKGNAREIWRFVKEAIDRAFIARRRASDARTRENAAVPALQAWALELDSAARVRVPRALPRRLLREAMSALKAPVTPYAVANHLGVNNSSCERAMKAAGLLG